MSKANRFICDACGKKCVIATENGFAPLVCPYSFGISPNWSSPPTFEKDDEWRHPYIDDDEYVANLTDEQKNEIVRSHMDCRMNGGCPCFLDGEYRCDEFMAYCELTGSDGSDFEFDDCWFRSNEHRCLTDYILWKLNGRA